MKSEKRKFTRFLVEEDAYAALGVNFTKVGKLNDISIGGLAFEYIECTENCVQDSSRVAIFHFHNDFHLPNLACRLICNLAISADNEDSPFSRQYVIHRCAIQFGDITAKQRKQLEFFINHYTCGTPTLHPVGDIQTK
ncbi:MAG: PilZ domain-containing protein [Deltaproteobacteria bacterium]|nr:PilZ domain-containing protein [Deltaproteobacteria bacterium]